MTCPLSVLDLAPVPQGETASATLRRTVDLARLAERLGFVRYWFAEHHNMPGIASSSPELLIGHIASATERIRVGSGGIMLPNHVPLQLAERFHTLAALHPGRIDLGLGRAPGTDPITVRALRSFDGQQFPQQLAELRGLSSGNLPEEHPFHTIRVVPDEVPLPPIWILGSSGAGAAFAGEHGYGYAFASHFSTTPAAPAMRAYRESFKPSPEFPRPHAILAASVICAETTEQARYLATSQELFRVRLHRGELGPLASSEEASAYPYTPADLLSIEQSRAMNITGDPETAWAELIRRAHTAQADEVMITTLVHDPAARLRSYELIAQAATTVTPTTTVTVTTTAA